MNTVPSAKIRNVALIGHGGSGKTTLAEALLVAAGVLTRAGRTEDGTTVCDFEPEELKRQISVSLALAPFLYEDCKINIIDTPGYADFVAEVEAGLSVADLAVLVVSAVEGVHESADGEQHHAYPEVSETDGDPGDACENHADDGDLVGGDAVPCESGTHAEARSDPAAGYLGR